MPTLSQAQIAVYAQSAGLSAAAARVAAAIAMAESGGRTTAHNPIPPDDSYGLWQINMLGSMGPDRRAKLGISSNSGLYDPAVNARAMAMLSGNGSNFGPWSTYGNGAYKKHLDGAAGQTGGAVDAGSHWWDPLGVAPGNDSVASDLPGAAALSSMAELMIGAGRWMSKSHNWVRVAQIVLGGGLTAAGLVVASRGAWQPVLDRADKQMSKIVGATPEGRAAKAAGGAKKAAGGAKKAAASEAAAPKAAAGGGDGS